MPDLDPETNAWLNEVTKGALPFGRWEDGRGLEILSTIECATLGVPSSTVTGSGRARWKLVNRSVRLPRACLKELRARFEFQCATWDATNPRVKAHWCETELNVMRYEPGSPYYPVKTASCDFAVARAGDECLRTEIVRNQMAMSQRLESQFRCRPAGGQTAETGSTPVSPPRPTGSRVIDVAIISIRAEENAAVLARFPGHQRLAGKKSLGEEAVCHSTNGGRLRVGIFRCLKKGQAEAKLVASCIMEDFAPRWIFLTGIAGGFPAEEFGLGDVVISSRFLDYSLSNSSEGKTPAFEVAGGKFHPEVDRILRNMPATEGHLKQWKRSKEINCARPPAPDTTDMTQALYGNQDWKDSVLKCLENQSARKPLLPLVHVGPAASGNVVLKDTEIARKWLESAKDLSAVEMELAGAYEGMAEFAGELPRIFCVRGISDIVGLKRQQSWLLYACHTAAAFTAAIIRSGELDPHQTEPPKP